MIYNSFSRAGGFSTNGLNGKFIVGAAWSINPPQPPVFTPNPISVPQGSPGARSAVKVQVTLTGPYDITLTIKKPEARASLFVPTMVRTTGDGTETFYIEDLADAKRGPITVTATISSQSPCGAPDVTSTFDVNVVWVATRHPSSSMRS